MLWAVSTKADAAEIAYSPKELQGVLIYASRDRGDTCGNEPKGAGVRRMRYDCASGEFIDLGALPRKPVLNMLFCAAECGSARFLGWLAKR